MSKQIYNIIQDKAEHQEESRREIKQGEVRHWEVRIWTQVGESFPFLNEVREGNLGASEQSKENSMCNVPEVRPSSALHQWQEQMNGKGGSLGSPVLQERSGVRTPAMGRLGRLRAGT